MNAATVRTAMNSIPDVIEALERASAFRRPVRVLLD